MLMIPWKMTRRNPVFHLLKMLVRQCDFLFVVKKTPGAPSPSAIVLVHPIYGRPYDHEPRKSLCATQDLARVLLVRPLAARR